VFRDSKPEILDLGPLCGETVVYLAGRGARVHVEGFEPPEPLAPKRPGETPAAPIPLRLDQPDGKFNLVLAWELPDFVPPDRLPEFGAELRRVLKDQGTLLLFSQSKPTSASECPARYRLLADDMIAREVPAERTHPRYTHPTREIERALKGFAVQGIQLQRNQMREIFAIKAGVG
jgi:hypothetical protein